VRDAFFSSLVELAANNPRLFLMIGDLGFGVVNEFVKRFPAQFINAGVAEQNMTGMAAGMARSGDIVFTYSIANFPILRCLEQVRNDVCYHRANVKMVSVGGGLCYGALGASHHATEDLAIMRALPNLLVVAPADPVEVRLAMPLIVAHPGPVYLRLGRAGEPVVHQTPPSGFALGKGLVVRRGDDLTLISTGGMLKTTLGAAELLAANGIRAGVISMHTVAPIDAELIRQHARTTGRIVTVEEHSVVGGLGGAVAEALLDECCHPVRFLRIGLPHAFLPEVGSQEYLLGCHGLTSEGIRESVLAFLNR
jgi:transketolase